MHVQTPSDRFRLCDGALVELGEDGMGDLTPRSSIEGLPLG